MKADGNFIQKLVRSWLVYFGFFEVAVVDESITATFPQSTLTNANALLKAMTPRSCVTEGFGDGEVNYCVRCNMHLPHFFCSKRSAPATEDIDAKIVNMVTAEEDTDAKSPEPTKQPKPTKQPQPTEKRQPSRKAKEALVAKKAQEAQVAKDAKVAEQAKKAMEAQVGQEAKEPKLYCVPCMRNVSACADVLLIDPELVLRCNGSKCLVTTPSGSPSQESSQAAFRIRFALRIVNEACVNLDAKEWKKLQR
eukprot:gene23454-17313_t